MIVSASYVYIQIEDKEMLFIKERNRVYNVNRDDTTLKVMETSDIVARLAQIRTLVGNIIISKEAQAVKFLTYPARSIEIKNTVANVSMKGELIILTLNGIQDTAYLSYMEYESYNDFLQIKKEKNEIVAYSQTVITLPNGITQTQTMRLLEIEKNIDFDMKVFESYRII
ncbi:MAG: hypothetical protein LBE56_03450 [Tannerella sp.]|jgi:hypothetical protein|nr:hypothetical protein [Tannerella sp.]